MLLEKTIKTTFLFILVLLSVKVSGTDYLWQLTDFLGDELFPDWSPDGSKIAYTYEGDIWTIPPQGGTPTQITTDPAADGVPDWSPDGSEIAFSSNRSGSTNIWVIPATGGQATQLTFEGSCYFPCWSPDGSTIAFYEYFVDEFSQGYCIVTIPAGGGEPLRLTDSVKDDRCPTWSPDGSSIAFYSPRYGGDDIWSVPASGGDLTLITGFDYCEREPDWSWSVDRIAYVWTDIPNPGDIYTVTGNGDDPRQVTFHEADDRYPSWSPNGEMIVFSSDRDGDFDIWIIKEQYQAVEPTSLGAIKAMFR